LEALVAADCSLSLRGVVSDRSSELLCRIDINGRLELMVTQPGACTEKRLPPRVTKVMDSQHPEQSACRSFLFRQIFAHMAIAHQWCYLSKLLNCLSLQYDSSGLELREMSRTRAARGLTQPAQQSSFVSEEASALAERAPGWAKP
jgi:hypothetical protein